MGLLDRRREKKKGATSWVDVFGGNQRFYCTYRHQLLCVGLAPNDERSNENSMQIICIFQVRYASDHAGRGGANQRFRFALAKDVRAVTAKQRRHRGSQ